MGAITGMLSGNQGTENFETVVRDFATNIVNNPNVRRVRENPAVQQLISTFSQESGIHSLSRIMNDMAPFMSSVLNDPSEPQSGEPDFSELPPERETIWRAMLGHDANQMRTHPHENLSPSPAYLSGRVTQSSSHGILPTSEESE